jgi:flagellar biosynthetic protein FliR
MSGLITALSLLSDSLSFDIWVAAALFSRISLFILMMPGLAGRVIPVRIRLIFALTLLVLLLPSAGSPSFGSDTASLTRILAGEAVTGLFFGLSLRFFLFALNITGSIIAQSLSLSQIFGATAEGDSASLISQALTMAGSALFLSSGLAVEAIGFLARELEAVPLGSFGLIEPGALVDELTRQAAAAIRFGVMLGLPFMVLNFAFYLLLGLLNRAMPQLMITFVGLPALTMGGLFLFALAITSLLSIWLANLSGLLVG